MAAVIHAPVIRTDDRLGLTLVLAAIVHSMVILGLGFSVKLKSESVPQSLDVILVQTEALKAPEEANYVAQANQQASGSTDSENRPSPSRTNGIAPIPAQAAIAVTPKPMESMVISSERAQDKVFTDKEHQPREANKNEARSQLQRNLEIAQLTAELAENERRYALRPRINYVDTVSAKSAVEAAYVKAWIQRVERLGNLNYPDEARRRQLSGSLILHVLLHNDGRVVRAQVGSPSGQQVLDDAALRIVNLASPFDPFPKEMRSNYDQLMITRTWVFRAGKSLVTR